MNGVQNIGQKPDRLIHLLQSAISRYALLMTTLSTRWHLLSFLRVFTVALCVFFMHGLPIANAQKNLFCSEVFDLTPSLKQEILEIQTQIQSLFKLIQPTEGKWVSIYGSCGPLSEQLFKALQDSHFKAIDLVEVMTNRIPGVKNIYIHRFIEMESSTGVVLIIDPTWLQFFGEGRALPGVNPLFVGTRSQMELFASQHQKELLSSGPNARPLSEGYDPYLTIENMYGYKRGDIKIGDYQPRQVIRHSP